MARIVRRGREYLENWRVNTGASGDSAGDILTFGQNEVFDADDKNKVGFDQGICCRIVPGKAWECIWTLALDKGQLTVEGPFYDKATRCSPSQGAPASMQTLAARWRSVT